MKAADLRKAILQYAVEGKLVPQDNQDEPASILYEKIIAEKENLIKQGKIKKEKPLPPITDDEIPYNIPENWKWVRLGEVFIVERGASPRPIASFLTNDENGINWIKIGDAKKGDKYITNTKEKITTEGAMRSRFVSIGDFIFSNSMSFGRPYILKINGCIHDGWNVIRQITNQINNIKINSDFIYYIISSSLLQTQIIKKAMGGIVENIKSDNLKTLLFPLPPLKEQERIVKKIDELMGLCDKLEQEEEKLLVLDKNFMENLPKSILQYAVEGKLVNQDIYDEPASILYEKIKAEKENLIKQGKIKKEKPLPPITNDDIPYEIPENWKWVRLGEVCDIIQGTSYNKSDMTQNKQDVRIIRGGNIKNYNINLLDDDIYIKQIYSNSEKQIYKNDIVIVASTGSKTILGNASFSSTNYNNTQIGAFLRIIRTRIASLFPYLKIIFMTQYYMNYIKINSNGIGINNIKNDTLNNFLIPLPPLKEQERIVKKVDELLIYCNKLKDIV